MNERAASGAAGDHERRQHLASLDSLRGVAALVVMFQHAVLVLPGSFEQRALLMQNGFAQPFAWLWLTPLRILVAGSGAVFVFFVLSGLVLALSLGGGRRSSYPAYLVKRIARIWPTFAVAILISAGLQITLAPTPVPGTSPWFAAAWDAPLTLRLIAQHLLMTGDATHLDSPMWTLVQELRISLIFPVLAWLTRINWRGALVASGALACAASLIVQYYGSDHYALLATACFCWLFVAGAALAGHLEGLRAKLGHLPAGLTCGLWLLALLLVSLTPRDSLSIGSSSSLMLLASAGGAAVLIVALCSAEGRAFQVLLGPVPRYLGRISYSLYLIHMVVIPAMLHWLGGTVPVLPLLLASLIVSIGAAHLLHVAVEQPTTRAGRRWAEALDKQRK